MTKQIHSESVLKDPRWASRILSGSNSTIALHLSTFPGVVGGVFHAAITGLTQDHYGEAEITISCTVINSHDSYSETKMGSAELVFQEIELLSIRDSSTNINFRIPFEAQATEEGATWHLFIKLNSGTTEIFEIPVCRTGESDPNLTAVQIASSYREPENQSGSISTNIASKKLNDVYTMDMSNGDMNLRLPSRTPGRVPSLAKGLMFFAGLWGAMTAFLYFLFDGPLDFIFIFGSVIFIMLVFIFFLLFGVSYCTFNKEKLTITHKLFGLALNWNKVSTVNLMGFSTKFLGAIANQEKSQLDYFVIAKTKDSRTILLCLTAFDKKEASLLAKRLNDYLKVIG